MCQVSSAGAITYWHISRYKVIKYLQNVEEQKM